MSAGATPENEDYLLMIARHGTAHHVEKLVSRYRRVERLRDVASANDACASRELKYFHDDDGSLVMNVRLPAEQGALVLKAIDMAIDSTADCAGPIDVKPTDLRPPPPPTADFS